MIGKLIAEEGLLIGLTLSFDEGDKWLAGRDPDSCQLLIEDPTVSRKQLTCQNTPAGIVIENISETNPVFVNDAELSEPRLLQHGDAVKIGSTLFYFYTDTAAQVDEINSTPNEAKHIINKQDDDNKQHEKINTEEQPVPVEDKTNNKSPEETIEGIMEKGYDTIYEEDTAAEGADDLAKIDFDLTETSRWLIKVLAGPQSGAEFAMQPSTSYVVGTDPTTCDIVFHDVSVSRQHTRITIGSDDATVIVEDLKSRNGTIIDGNPIDGRKIVSNNTLVTTGTTTFIVFDREGKRDTIISPLLPSIVKVLQKDEERKEEKAAAFIAPTAAQLEEQAARDKAENEKSKEKVFNILGASILIAILLGVFIVMSVGISTLFETKEVAKSNVNVVERIDTALKQFPSIKYSYNEQTGNLLLVGHVLTGVDHTQLLYNLQGIPSITKLSDNIVVDENIWQEANQILSTNPGWRAVTIQTSQPGTFVVTGYLQTRKQAEQLSDYLSLNFPYPELLEKRIVVEEDLVAQIKAQLQGAGLYKVTVKFFNGEVTFGGSIPFDSGTEFETSIEQIKKFQGVRTVNNLVSELAPEQSIINITDRYTVTGYSHQGDVNINVVVNGKILSVGDSLDGMMITTIKPNVIYLEKDSVKYRIDNNK